MFGCTCTLTVLDPNGRLERQDCTKCIVSPEVTVLGSPLTQTLNFLHGRNSAKSRCDKVLVTCLRSIVPRTLRLRRSHYRYQQKHRCHAIEFQFEIVSGMVWKAIALGSLADADEVGARGEKKMRRKDASRALKVVKPALKHFDYPPCSYSALICSHKKLVTDWNNPNSERRASRKMA